MELPGKTSVPTLPKTGEGWGTHVSVLEDESRFEGFSRLRCVRYSLSDHVRAVLRFKGLDTWPRPLARDSSAELTSDSACLQPAEMCSRTTVTIVLLNI